MPDYADDPKDAQFKSPSIRRHSYLLETIFGRVISNKDSTLLVEFLLGRQCPLQLQSQYAKYFDKDDSSGQNADDYPRRPLGEIFQDEGDSLNNVPVLILRLITEDLQSAGGELVSALRDNSPVGQETSKVPGVSKAVSIFDRRVGDGAQSRVSLVIGHLEGGVGDSNSSKLNVQLRGADSRGDNHLGVNGAASRSGARDSEGTVGNDGDEEVVVG